jgi:hypothetical protein
MAKLILRDLFAVVTIVSVEVQDGLIIIETSPGVAWGISVGNAAMIAAAIALLLLGAAVVLLLAISNVRKPGRPT